MRSLTAPAVANGDAAPAPAPAAPRWLAVGGDRLVPVYSLRIPHHHEAIARALAAGQPAAFYVGLFGLGQALRPAWLGHADAETYWRVKTGRPRWAKVPLFCQPHRALRLLDFRLVHPAFRHLARREHFERLWSSHGVPLHVIAPVRQPLRFLDPALVTSAADLRHQATGLAAPASQPLPPATVCCFWVADPLWEAVVSLATLYSPARVCFGASSLNDHGEAPPYTLADLHAFLTRRAPLPVALVITDELYERAGAFSSHTQVRLPFVDEPPALVVVRRGCLGADWLAEATGYPVRVLPQAGLASRHEGLSDATLRRRLEQLGAWRQAGAR